MQGLARCGTCASPLPYSKPEPSFSLSAAGAGGQQGSSSMSKTRFNTIAGNIAANRLFGTDRNDKIFGDRGLDRLYGREANDKLYGGDGNDRLFGEAGNDYLYGDSGSDWLYGGIGNDRLYGDVGDDVLNGGEGNDLLYGGAGNNTLSGGAGNDLIYGSWNDDLLQGGDGKDRLFGDTGNDRLQGGYGNDLLSGGEGYDTFVFATALDAAMNVDRITDFNPWADRIVLKGSIFTGLRKAGKLSSDAFWIGPKAHDASDRIIYDKANGTLNFDPDGTGSAAQVKFAVIGTIDLSKEAFWIAW
jgi:Ca2+-binding RTX toxin-like protein